MCLFVNNMKVNLNFNEDELKVLKTGISQFANEMLSKKLNGFLQNIENTERAKINRIKHSNNKLIHKQAVREKKYNERVKLAEERRNRLILEQTPAERTFKAKLSALKIKFEFQKIIYTNKNSFFIVDFFIPAHRLILELDGGYHNSPIQKIKDNDRKKELRELGFKRLKRLNN